VSAKISANATANALIAEAERRLFDESVPRLKKCLALLPEEAIWTRPNDQLVSVGDLVLHLCGNARQWISSGLGGLPDNRDRDAEFAPKDPLQREELIARLDAMEVEIRGVLDRLDRDSLLNPRKVQCFEETGLSILVHVVEHFSYHVGQVSFATKAMLDKDLGYYEGLPLSKRDGE